MENKFENKVRFMMQYFGQKVVPLKGHLKGQYTLICSYSIFENIPFIHLKDVSEVTKKEEDFIKSKFHWSDEDFTDFKSNIDDYMINYETVDYLRSKGYAMPFMDLKLSDLLDYGWVKIKPKH